MRRFIFVLLLCSVTASACRADYLGDLWKINDYITVKANTFQVSSGGSYDASAITYRIYEESTNTEIVTDTAMTKFDSETGFYLDRVQLLTATGFESGKTYTVLVKATVDGVSGSKADTFRIGGGVVVAGDIVDILINTTDHNIVGSVAWYIKKILAELP